MKNILDIRKFAKKHYFEVTNIIILDKPIQEIHEYQFDGFRDYICIVPKSKRKDIIEWINKNRQPGEYEIHDNAILYRSDRYDGIKGYSTVHHGYKVVFDYALMVLNNEI